MLVTLVAVMLVAGAAAAAYAGVSVDRGRSTPPARFQGERRGVWKVEWGLCSSESLPALASEAGLPGIVRSEIHYAAGRIAWQLEYGTYHPWLFQAAYDGCANGIIYRHYHLVSSR